MHNRKRFVAINGRALRSRRLQLGWTQRQLAKAAGYTERLIRKAESGGSLDIATVQNLAESLSSNGDRVSSEALILDILAIARQWIEALETQEQGMLSQVEHYLAEQFVLICPGDPATAPFLGSWHGAAGLQQWLDLYFGFFKRNPCQDLEFTVGEHSVMARWLESGTMQGIPCGPVRINMHFRFENGLIVRIDDDYDTQAGANAVASARTKLGDGPPLV